MTAASATSRINFVPGPMAEASFSGPAAKLARLAEQTKVKRRPGGFFMVASLCDGGEQFNVRLRNPLTVAESARVDRCARDGKHRDSGACVTLHNIQRTYPPPMKSA